MKKIVLIGKLSLLAVGVPVLVCLCARSENSVDFLTSQGLAALNDKHYKDAAGWLKRAEILNDADKHPKTEAYLWVAIGYSKWKAGDYAEAEEAVKKARLGFEHACGAMSPEGAGVLNLWAEIYTDEGRYMEAFQLLQEALEWSEGKYSDNYNDVATVPFRVARMGMIAEVLGLSADNCYANAIDYLTERIRSCHADSREKIQAAVKQLFADWKVRLEKKPSTAGCVAFNNLWSQVYGRSSAASMVPASTGSSALLWSPAESPVAPGIMLFPGFSWSAGSPLVPGTGSSSSSPGSAAKSAFVPGTGLSSHFSWDPPASPLVPGAGSLSSLRWPAAKNPFVPKADFSSQFSWDLPASPLAAGTGSLSSSPWSAAENPFVPSTGLPTVLPSSISPFLGAGTNLPDIVCPSKTPSETGSGSGNSDGSAGMGHIYPSPFTTSSDASTTGWAEQARK